MHILFPVVSRAEMADELKPVQFCTDYQDCFK